MHPPKKQVSILIVDDSPEDREVYRRMFGRLGDAHHVCSEADTGEEGLERCRADAPDCVMLDYRLPDMNGLEFLSELVDGGDQLPFTVIMFTGEGDETVAVEAMKRGVLDYMVKTGITEEALGRAVNNAVEKASLQRRLSAAQIELKKNNVRLHEFAETATRFVDNVAHEFRTPLSVIKEFSAIISDGLGGPVTDDQVEYLQFIDSATRDLSQMVDDFLDSSKLRSRSLRVDRQSHTIADLIASVRTTIQNRAKTRKITIAEEIEDDIPDVFCDLEKVGRVIVNLVVNAIKFSPEGSVVRLCAQPHPNGGVRIGVVDEGSGLTPADLQVVCERFRQVGDMQNTCAKGFGLGLSIAKELVWLNLGRMEISSRRGEGSRFGFTLAGCDPEQVLRRFIGMFDATSDETEALTLVRATPRCGELMELRSFLSSVCYPMDLNIPAIEADAIVLIGPTDEPDGWISRLHAVWERRAGNDPDYPVPPFDLTWLGTWSNPSRKDEVVQTAMNQVLGIPAGA